MSANIQVSGPRVELTAVCSVFEQGTKNAAKQVGRWLGEREKIYDAPCVSVIYHRNFQNDFFHLKMKGGVFRVSLHLYSYILLDLTKNKQLWSTR